ncbi:hypothetical protein AMAG_16285 [Allomyces macrogynus ATCC 38327]|uniref:Uncharacterized protein n=1 Tax=Allomyces macrogynus (strain ATCC 38327) TaxID=578462 RepID=A0A0L0TAW6_ALLM3|nr:hypothetical protein AMAG_16285 [Allomyces macrogynus ATCC 38327]|eukprot:KNE71855.1 hypothetical protein AMAG_16285 [Allomyces macrogynus ATCC 38327]
MPGETNVYDAEMTHIDDLPTEVGGALGFLYDYGASHAIAQPLEANTDALDDVDEDSYPRINGVFYTEYFQQAQPVPKPPWRIRAGRAAHDDPERGADEIVLDNWPAERAANVAQFDFAAQFPHVVAWVMSKHLCW